MTATVIFKKVRTNSGVGPFVRTMTPFRSPGIIGDWVTCRDTTRMYVVFSFTRAWPIFVYHDGKWYRNSSWNLGSDRLSRFRKQHRGDALPVSSDQCVDMEMLDMDEFVVEGLAAHPDMKRLLDVSVEN